VKDDGSRWHRPGRFGEQPLMKSGEGIISNHRVRRVQREPASTRGVTLRIPSGRMRGFSGSKASRKMPE
jgi:hypothetical protein